MRAQISGGFFYGFPQHPRSDIGLDSAGFGARDMGTQSLGGYSAGVATTGGSTAGQLPQSTSSASHDAGYGSIRGQGIGEARGFGYLGSIDSFTPSSVGSAGYTLQHPTIDSGGIGVGASMSSQSAGGSSITWSHGARVADVFGGVPEILATSDSSVQASVEQRTAAAIRSTQSFNCREGEVFRAEDLARVSGKREATVIKSEAPGENVSRTKQRTDEHLAKVSKTAESGEARRRRSERLARLARPDKFARLL